MDLIFATNNRHKVKEINQLLDGSNYNMIPMYELGLDEDIEETGSTLQENAIIKSNYLYQKFATNVISEDTGLEVTALDMAPGVYTARYAGSHKNNDDNMALLLKNLENKDRSAQFRTVVSLILNGEQHLFEGIVKGKIATKKMGNKGFGYDPVFIPEGYDRSFAQLESDVKSKISHRSKAIRKLIQFLQSK